jgi:NAD(P)-dependent dehydrogenase (short-subunit alcohol dehydrogenase family)
VIATENGDERTKLADALRKDGVNAYPLRCVMTDEDQITDALTSAIDTLGRIDIFVWIAEELPFTAPYLDEQRETVAERAELSLAGLARACSEVAAHMASRSLGSVIVVTSPPNARPWPDITATAANFALVELTRTLALDWVERGVRVNVISPERTCAAFLGASKEDRSDGTIDVGRSGQSPALKGLTDTVVWLASDAANRVTGALIPLGGERGFLVGQGWRHLLANVLADSSDHRPHQSYRHLRSVGGRERTAGDD